MDVLHLIVFIVLPGVNEWIRAPIVYENKKRYGPFGTEVRENRGNLKYLMFHTISLVLVTQDYLILSSDNKQDIPDSYAHDENESI